jgi:hypothetical protein
MHVKTSMPSVASTLVACCVVSSGVLHAAANVAPIISGTPASTAAVGAPYAFLPSSRDANGDRLGFTIVNRPNWIGFSTSSGRITGVPGKWNAGTYSNIVIKVSDGKATTALRPFSITVPGAGGTTPASGKPPSTPTSNGAPRISGSPATAVTAGTAYAFTPTASSANKRLTFSIKNKPSWAAFSTANGKLSGTPSTSSVGTYSGIGISVSDGKASAYLGTFAIAVTQIGSGSATVHWTPPTQNSNGSALTNLAGYRIHYGTKSAALDRQIQVGGTGLTSYYIASLAPATYYFAITAVNSAGMESAYSNLASKAVR